MSEKKKLKLVESFSYSIPKDKLQETILLKSDNKKLVESLNEQLNLEINPSEPFKCYAVIKDIPVTRFTLNANNRIYTKKLWQKVQQKGSAERSFCHANHSEDDGDVTKFFAVWHNFRVLDDICVADLYVVDNEIGRSLVGLLLAGGLIHFSSFGFGDMLYDEFGEETQYVDPDCYELMRLGDWVSVSSQNVITTIDENAIGIQPKTESKENLGEKVDPKQSVEEQINHENLESKNNFLESNNTNNKTMEKNIMNESENEIKLDYWKNRVKVAIKESAEKLEANKFNESLAIMSEVKNVVPVTLKDLHEKIESNILTINSKQTEVVKNLQENLPKIMEEIEALKKENVDLKKIAEVAVKQTKEVKKEQIEGELVSDDPEATVEEVADSIETKVDELIQATEVLTDVIDQKDEVITDLQDQVMELEADVQASSIEAEVVLASAEEKVSELKDTIEDLTSQVAVMESKIKEYESKKDLKEEILSGDFPDTPTRAITTDEQEYREEEEEDVSEYVDKLIQENKEYRENVVFLKQSKNIEAVNRKVENIKAMKEERNLTSNSKSTALDIDFSVDPLPTNKVR